MPRTNGTRHARKKRTFPRHKAILRRPLLLVLTLHGQSTIKNPRPIVTNTITTSEPPMLNLVSLQGGATLEATLWHDFSFLPTHLTLLFVEEMPAKPRRR